MSEFRWDHLHLRSPDPEATARYYVDVFGATPVNRVDAGGALRVIVNLAGLNLFIEQVPARDARSAPPSPPWAGAHRACGDEHRCGLRRVESARGGVYGRAALAPTGPSDCLCARSGECAHRAAGAKHRDLNLRP